MNLNQLDRLTFEDLNLPSDLLLGIYKMGFLNGPSDIQSLVLPYSLSETVDRNIIVQSKSGTGKTISYIIHILARIQSIIDSHSQVLIIVPTVELAFTVGSGIENMSSYISNIDIAYMTSCRFSQISSLRETILIATIDTFESFEWPINLSNLKLIVIDEIDAIIIRDDYRRILVNLIDNISLVDDCQILACSSILSKQILNYAIELIPNSILIKQRPDKQQLVNIEQFYVRNQNEMDKLQTVNIILKQFLNTQIMIFCSDDETAQRIYETIPFENQNVTRILTTKFTNQQRIQLIEKFRRNFFQIFILSAQTSSTTHGIDLDNVNIIINYNLPRSLGINADLDYVTYYHRLDRCGRYDKHGHLFNLIQSVDDWNIQLGQENYFSFVIKQIDNDRIRELVL